MIRVLVVDDSAAMRGLIAAALHRDPDISVVGQAANPFEARDAIKALNPDVLTLDVEMPGMTGLDFLEKIMRLRPMPVIMVSTRTAHGTEATLQALELGAVDCVAKPNSASPDSFDTLPVKIHEAARARIRPLPRHALATAPTPSPAAADYRPDGRLLAIGASTGGVEALITVLSHLPANGPPTVITQHMPENFTRSFAARLDRICAATVVEGSDGAVLTQGRVYLAPGGSAHLEVVNSRPWQCRLREAAPVNGHRPSVDVLFASVAAAAGPRAVGVILTGMGRDGAQGLLAMREAGAATLGQDEATSVVYGMPRVAFEMAAVQRQMPLERIGAEIVRMTHAQARRDG